MKLDRNKFGHGKYALLKLRGITNPIADAVFGEVRPEIRAAIRLLEENGVVDYGHPETESEFFVIRLKDKYAQAALNAYANAAGFDDSEYADEIRELAGRAGLASQWCKRPD